MTTRRKFKCEGGRIYDEEVLANANEDETLENKCKCVRGNGNWMSVRRTAPASARVQSMQSRGEHHGP